jgi:hypothetical protein
MATKKAAVHHASTVRKQKTHPAADAVDEAARPLPLHARLQGHRRALRHRPHEHLRHAKPTTSARPPLRHPEARRLAPPLRLPPRLERRPQKLGRRQGPQLQPRRPPPRRPGRRPPHGVRRLRGHHPRRASTAAAPSWSGTRAPGGRSPAARTSTPASATVTSNSKWTAPR